LRACKLQRQGEEKEQTDGLDPHIRILATSPLSGAGGVDDGAGAAVPHDVNHYRQGFESHAGQKRLNLEVIVYQ
jgi:hypothetical protein